MEIEYWFMLAYVVGTLTGWWMFRFTNSDREELIANSCDQFLNLLIAGNCVKVKHLQNGEVEILTIEEATQELDK